MVGLRSYTQSTPSTAVLDGWATIPPTRDAEELGGGWDVDGDDDRDHYADDVDDGDDDGDDCGDAWVAMMQA